ncbi:MAG TPA: site-2 protease family protein [Anaerolineales bacterium]|nr:site-2 protease family protein [Anaerolineales bacterium]
MNSLLLQGSIFGIDLPTLIARLVVLVIAFAFHEFAHAWTADRFGDMTPRSQGRLTLNPLVHLDPIGSLMLLVAGFGWARPVPINPYALSRRSPAAVMWVSLAGPLSNFLLAVLGAIAFRLLDLAITSPASNPALSFFFQFLYYFVQINLLLLVFNLIPLPPLDGDKILDYFLPPAWSRALEPIRPYGPMILLMLIFLAPLLGRNILFDILGPPMELLSRLLLG